MHAAIPGSSLVVLDRAGHLCNLERPAEFDAALNQFLSRVAPA
jgi:pimeloyl-ACP methyl ester carboxylesterase